MEINFEIKSKGSLKIYFGEKVATISGELTFEPPVFYADLNSFNNWESPFENEVIEENQKNELVTFIINSNCSTKIIFE
jgi:hypothetical protein